MPLKFSQDMELLLKQLANQSLTIEQILAITSERGFSLIIILFVLPFLFPMPPGLTGILGTGCLFLAIQMSLGRKKPYLPKKIAKFTFPRKFSYQLLKNLKRVTTLLEKITRPRWGKIARSSYVWRTNGLCIAWLAFLLMLPVPFTNPLPATGILLLAVGNLEGDGLLMCLGYGVTLVNTLFFVFICYALWQTTWQN